jgi:hypothetical protein
MVGYTAMIRRRVQIHGGYTSNPNPAQRLRDKPFADLLIHNGRRGTVSGVEAAVIQRIVF